MLLDICLGNKSAWRILILYGESPGAGFTRQDFRKHTKIGNKALTIALKRLTAFGILKKTKEQHPINVYKFNVENSYAGGILNLLKKERTDTNSLPYEFSIIAREFSREVIDAVEIQSIYLFGSVAKGTYRLDSDVDFAVVVKKKTPESDILLNEISERLSHRYKKKIQCFLMEESSMNARKGLAEEIIKHGIKLV
jgi:predicted nucleotidyltransferase/DNA-binding HxlR family transcriptional regulator